MAAQTVYGIAIPDAGVAAGFTNGELALAVASPQNTAATGVVYHLGKWLTLRNGGVYRLKINTSKPCSFWIGSELISTRRVVSLNGQQGSPVEADFFVREGAQRINIALTNPSAGNCFVVFSIWKDGAPIYSSAAAGWLFDTVFVPDATLPAATDYRLALPVFMLTPNWKSGITERLSWLTEIMVSETSEEQRRSLLTYPRRTFEGNFMRSGEDRMRLNDFITGVGYEKFLAPFWPEQMRCSQVLSIGNTSLTFPAGRLAGREFAADDLVLISRGTKVFEVVEVETVTQTATVDTITFKGGVTKAWASGYRITPLHVVRFETLPALSNITDKVGTAQIRFELDETFKTTEASWGYCAPLWRFKYERKTAVQNQFARLTYVIDNQIAPIDLIDYGDVSKVGVRAGVRLIGRERVASFKSFLAMARGRALRFWLPSGTNDLEVAGGFAGGVTFEAKATGYAEWLLLSQDARKTITIELNDGNPSLYRRVIGVERIGDFDRFTLDRALPAINAAQVGRVSFILPVRFDQDTFELHHHTDSAKVVDGSVTFMSSNIDDMPDIECAVTSWTYPALASDSLRISAMVTGGKFGGVPPTTEGLNITAAMTAGLLRTMLLSNDMGAEGLNISAAITAGLLRTILLSNDMGAEGLNISAAMTAGTLQAVLISITTYAPEGLNISAAITGGTLT